MSISEIFRVVRADIEKDDHASVSAIKTPKILSIGGCVTEVISNRLNRLANVTHLWRVTVPCLMSSKVDGRTYFESHSHQLSERINFELTKQPLQKLKTGGYEFLIFDPTSDFTNDYYEKDGCIISDMSSGIVGPDWKWPDGFLAEGWNRLSPQSYRYLEIYVHYLKQLIDLSEKIGVPLIILKRRTCINKITHDGITGLGEPESAEINWWVDLLWGRINSLTNKLTVLDLNGRLSVTSFDAPYNEGRYHPIEEFYDYAFYKLMYLLRFGDDLISEMVFHVYRERASRRLAIHLERNALITERDGLIQERDSLRSSLDHVEAERDAMLAHERDLARAERDRHAGELSTICEARDAAFAEKSNDLLTLQSERDGLVRERDALIHERDLASAERDDHSVKLATICETRDAAFAENASYFLTLQNERDELIQARDDLLRERNSLQAERDHYAGELTTIRETRDATVAENTTHVLALANLHEALAELSHRHAALSLQQRRLFEDLRLDGGPMALRDVLPLARAWRPVIKGIGKVKRFHRRLTGLFG